MPKIKDLGIKVIPETMQPPEIGGGGGGAPCPGFTQCVPTIQPCVPTPIPCFPTHNCFPTNNCHLPTLCHGCTYFLSCHGCTHFGAVTVICQFHTLGGGGCGAISPVCGGSLDPTILQTPAITNEHIAALKEQLQKQLASLDEMAKNVSATTAQQLDAREKQLNEELAQLKTRRKDLDKK